MLRETDFYFVRHGQTDWNLEHRAQGQTDIPLNEEGRRQARLAANVASRLDIATICCSPLSRALETAQIIQSETAAQIEVIDELMECSWGDREGERKGVWYEAWKRGLEIPPGAEPYDQFIDRALSAINQALTHPGPVLIVAHGGIYWAVQIHATRDLGQSAPNAQIIEHTAPTEAHPWWQSASVRQ
ncbi:MAG: hypothetical protein Hens2KO_30080 [Henriciella sp.]